MRLVFWTVLLFGMWMILSANLQTSNIFIGLGISFVVAFTYTKMFQAQKLMMINPFYLGVYVLILLKNIVLSNIQIAIRLFSKDMKLSPAIVGVKTELKSDWKKLLLANSITLTPGTLTLELKDDTLYIHTIECKNIEQKTDITKEFEDIIAKI